MSIDLTGYRVPNVSIVVPCYNESDAIASVVARLHSYLVTLSPRVTSEIVAVDDGSADSTATILDALAAEGDGTLRVVHHARNAGLTAAMRTGAEHARSDVVLFLDADLSYAPETIGALLAAKRKTGAAVAIASPYMAGGRVGNVPLVRLVASRGANWLLSFTVGRRIRTFTGMVRAWDRATFLKLASQIGPGEFNAAMIAHTLRSGLGIVEVPAALVWPVSRTAAPARLSLVKLRERAQLVFATLGILRQSGKGWVTAPRNGPLVLVQRPKGPYVGFQ